MSSCRSKKQGTAGVCEWCGARRLSSRLFNCSCFWEICSALLVLC